MTRHHSEPEILVYADGSCLGNPGPGGWGVVIVGPDGTREYSGSEAQTTNNRMELTAVIEALAALKKPSRQVVHTDSQYVKLGISVWLAQWEKRGWKTAGGKPVKNLDLWKRLAEVAAPHRIEWRWVPGHAGVEGNERVDRLANEAIDAMLAGSPSAAGHE